MDGRTFWAGTAVVTGAGSGLGAAMADRFAAEGMAVVALDIDGERAETQAQVLRDRGGRAIAMGLDVSDRQAMEAAARVVEREFGGCTVLCANVGVQQFGAVEKLTEAEWRWVLDVNVLGTVNTVAAFLPLLRATSGNRRVLLTASSAALVPGVRLAAYIASKHAVMGYGETLRLELAAEGIGVTIFFPAGMTTRHLESSELARPAELGPATLASDDIEAMMASRKVSVDTHTATPEHATRHLLAELAANERYVVSHGQYRDELVSRCRELVRAYDRAQSS